MTETKTHHSVYRALGYKTNHLWLCEHCDFQSEDETVAHGHETTALSQHITYPALGGAVWLCETCDFESHDERGAHEHQTAHLPKWSEELGIRQLLLDMAELREHAEAVARLVFELRWPKSRTDRTIKADLTWTLEEGSVDASYYAGHGEDDSFSFPIHYLWSDRETIVAAEQVLAAETARKAAEKLAAEEADRQRRRRAEYERLKAEFEQEPA